MPNSRYAASIADLYGRIGAAKAQGVIGRANAWIPAVQAIPASLGQWADARDNRKVQAQQAQLREFQLREGARGEEQQTLADWDKSQIRALGAKFPDDPEGMAREVNVINPELAAPYEAKAKAARAEMAQHLRRFALTVTGAPDEKKEDVWNRGSAIIVKAFPRAAAKFPKGYDPAFIADILTETASDAQLEESVKPKPVTTPLQALQIMKAEADLMPAAPKVPDDKEQAYRDYNTSIGRKPDTPLTFAEKRKVDGMVAAATRAPEKASADEATRAQIATAERWRADQLNQLDTLRRGRIDQYTGERINPMPAADYQAAKARIEDAYRQSLGIPAPGPSMAAPLPGPPRTVQAGPVPAPGLAPGLPPAGPSSASAAPTRQPAVNAPSAPIVQPNTPAATATRQNVGTGAESIPPPATPLRRPIPGIPGAEAEFRNGRWIRVK